MDFNDTAEEADWREECRSWIADHLPIVDALPGKRLTKAKAWQRTKYDAGLAKIMWEPELGGRNGSAMQHIIFGQEEAKVRVPPSVCSVGTGTVGPTLRMHGTDRQRTHHLQRILRGEDLWCQLFSEPGAGSDIASLSTTAELDGDEWVVNGQKVWTSGAHYSDYGELICRTDIGVPKHQGITAMIVDMKAPGVEVRPLRQMSGRADFNEVFLDDVRVPVVDVIGQVNDGWHVAVTSLVSERVSFNSAGAGLGGSVSVTNLAKVLRESGCTTDAVRRQTLANLHIHTRIRQLTEMRSLTAALRGEPSGPPGSIGKLFTSQLLTRCAEAAMAIGGPAVLDAEGPYAEWQQAFLVAPGMRIGGGTDEVLKNLIAERVLGLPTEPREDDTVPWRDLPR